MNISLVKSLAKDRICFNCHKKIPKDEPRYIVMLSSRRTMRRLGISASYYKYLHICLNCWTIFYPKLIAIEREGYVPIPDGEWNESMESEDDDSG